MQPLSTDVQDRERDRLPPKKPLVNMDGLSDISQVVKEIGDVNERAKQLCETLSGAATHLNTAETPDLNAIMKVLEDTLTFVTSQSTENSTTVMFTDLMALIQSAAILGNLQLKIYTKTFHQN